ncbi:MAG: PepSY-associated TM helix domain-containing protein, partial [Bacteroidota bacterium]
LPGPPPARRSRKGWGLGRRAQRLMWDAHSGVGALLGLVFFVVFFSGSFALYRGAIEAWSDPGLRGPSVFSTDALVQRAFDERPPEPGTAVTIFPVTAERTSAFIRYAPADETTPEGETTTVVRVLSSTTGEEVIPGGRSRAALTIYQLHILFQLRYVLPGTNLIGIAIVGVLSAFLLFLIASGLLIHLKKLPKDWHTFRPRERVRTAIADAHTVLGLIGLPFTVAFALTGGILCVMIILGPYIVSEIFDGDAEAYAEALYPIDVPEADSTGQSVPMLLPDQLADALPPTWDRAPLTQVAYSHWGDAGATAVVYGRNEETLTEMGKAVVNPATGEVLTESPPETPSALAATYSATERIHYVQYGGWVAAALSFLLSLAASAMMLTGNILWVLVRRPKDPRATPWLHKLMARLTVGVGVGLVAATPVLFLLAQAIPADYADRKLWEEAGFFIAWGVLTLSAFVGPSAVAASRWQLRLAAGLSVLVPVANGVATGGWVWVAAANGWWATFGIDVGFLIAAPLLWWTAARLPQHTASPPQEAPRNRSRAEAPPVVNRLPLSPIRTTLAQFLPFWRGTAVALIVASAPAADQTPFVLEEVLDISALPAGCSVTVTEAAVSFDAAGAISSQPFTVVR